jgi:F-type H+-transporting ATPase subunit b
MHLDGWTFAFQVVNFLVLAGLLWRFLYRPVLEAIARRQAAVAAALDQAEQARAEAARLAAEHAAAQAALAADLARLRQELAAEAEALRARSQDEARRAGERLLAETRERLEAERTAAVRALHRAGTALAGRLARRLLAGIDAEALTAAFLPPLEAALAGLDPPTRAAMAAELAAGAAATVASAAPLDAGQRRQWQQRLDAALGAALHPEFVTEPDLIAGAELRLPGHRVACHWAGQLDHMLEEVGHGHPG